jgi:hypothetical protein
LEHGKVTDLNWSKTVHKVVISGLLVAGLNQSLLLSLADFQQKQKPRTIAVSCACPPTACSCPPTNGCEHNHKKPEKKRGISEYKIQITVCRPKTGDHTNTVGMDVLILTRHTDSITPYPAFTYIGRFYHDSTSQNYLIPLDKPPQTSLV